MPKRKVLYICHNHPSVRPGGAEEYALELYEGMRCSEEFEPILLAKGGPPMSSFRQPHAGTLFAPVNDDPHQYFFYTSGEDFDSFYGTSRDKDCYTRAFHDFLVAFRPEIVHFQHTVHLGYDLLRQVKNSLPDAAIVYTLHEFLPLCHHHGQMVRTFGNELCHEASPRRCHECYPDISPQRFFLRQRFIQGHLSLVDRFLAPSRFLLERYAAWGIPREKLRYEPNGRRAARPAGGGEDRPRRNRLGYFGQFSVFKGIQVLLKAMQILDEGKDDDGLAPFPPLPGPASAGARDAGPHLWLHGANLELQAGTFQNEVRALLDETRRNVTVVGRYRPDELPRLMAAVDWVIVPSIWWENAPLVIQEAFQHGRPVICSDIGGMAEQVAHGVNGLHFRVGDPRSLADTIRLAVDSPGLWETLRGGIPPVYTIEDQVATLTHLYRDLLSAKVAQER